MKNSRQILIVLSLTAIISCSAGKSFAWKGISSRTPTTPPSTEDSGAHEVRKKISSQHQEEMMAVVARINGTEISMKKLMNTIMKIIMEKFGDQTISNDLAQQIRYEALQELTLEELAYQRALTLGIEIDEQTINQQIEAIQKSAGSPEAFRQSLANKQQTLADLKTEIGRFLAVKKAIKLEVEDKIIISDKAVEKTYQDNIDQFVIPEQIVITDIIFFLDPEDQETKNKVISIRNKIIDELHNNPNRLEASGLTVMPGIKVSQLNYPDLYNEAKKLALNEISDFLVIDGTPHLIKLEHFQAEQKKPEENVKSYIRRSLMSRKHKAALIEWRQNLNKGAEIEIVHELLQSKTGNESTGN